jgi:hypothetical protein
MISRIYTTGFVVIFGVGAMLAPNETFARSGGFGGSGGIGGRSFQASSSFRPSALQSQIHVSPRNLRPPIHITSPIAPSRLHQRNLGFGVPLGSRLGIGVPLAVPVGSFPYGGYDVPPDYAEPFYQPSYADPDAVTGGIPDDVHPVVVHRPGCRSQTVILPAEDGGERTINILRC